MLNPIPLGPSLLTDGRDNMNVLAGLIEGPESAIVARTIVMIARWSIGGIGADAGMGIAVTAMIVALKTWGAF